MSHKFERANSQLKRTFYQKIKGMIDIRLKLTNDPTFNKLKLKE